MRKNVDIGEALRQYITDPDRSPEKMAVMPPGAYLPDVRFPITFARPYGVICQEVTDAVIRHYRGCNLYTVRQVNGYGGPETSRAIRVIANDDDEDNFFVVVTVDKAWIRLDKLVHQEGK